VAGGGIALLVTAALASRRPGVSGPRWSSRVWRCPRSRSVGPTASGALARGAGCKRRRPALACYTLVIGPQRQRPRISAYWAGDFPPLEGVPSAGWLAGQLLDFVAYACGQPAWLAAAVTVAGLLLATRWLGLAAPREPW